MRNSFIKKISNFKALIAFVAGLILLISLNSRIYRDEIEYFKNKYIRAQEKYNDLALENDKAKERKESYVELKKKYDELNEKYTDYEKNTLKTLDEKIADLKSEVGE
ncbi:hypothetical protein [Clostridium sp. LIBA-8841]|uniref:hypothetical protein n=1 Tax=Clostridium sp. LIBA-8841 TaxID=2987530 RepID=UPI002AC43B63|nr:hypothetical protein [Clostridium sp. LIBA-8841]MDZ5252136.1 hypothetical protein [Clostridium sp. LIBA-8841]